MAVKNMNNQVELTDALLKAVNRVVSQNNIQNNSTSVIEGVITAVLDSGQGNYEIEYMDTKFFATSSSKNYTYEVGDKVYVLVPDGDMSNTKIIIAAVSSQIKKIEIASKDNYYLPYGDNILFLYNYSEAEPFGLSTYRDDSLPEGKSISLTAIDQIRDAFTSELRFTNTFDFTFKVMTDIQDASRRINGTYGLYLKIPIIQDSFEKEIEINFDINQMVGNPYDFSVYTEQHFYFNVPENAEIDRTKPIELKGFCEGFPKDPEEDSKIDIYFIDIGLVPVKVLNYQDKDGYNLKLTATKGSFFAKNIIGLESTKNLIPNLYYQGSLIDLANNSDTYKCYWFIEDHSINEKSMYYHSNGGVGWRILNERIMTKQDDEEPYVLDKYTYKISDFKVRYELRYKCVIVIKNQEILSDTILIKNLSSNISLDLTTSTGSNVYVADLGNAELIMKYFDDGITNSDEENIKYEYEFYWQRYNRNGTLISFDTSQQTSNFAGENENRLVESHIKCSVMSIDKINTFECTVVLKKIIVTDIVDPDNPENFVIKSEEIIIGSRSISIITTEQINLNIEIENDVKFFKYDWSGNSPLLANYDGSPSAKEKLIKPIYIKRITDENGMEFTEEQLETFEIEWYVPKDTEDENGNITYATMIALSNNVLGSYKWVEKIENGKSYYTLRGYFKDLRSLEYTIKDKFNQAAAEKGNNVIILKAYLKDKVITKYINNIIFSKDGKSGTNGTNYSAVVVYGIEKDDGAMSEVYEYGELDPDTGLPHKFQLLFIADLGEMVGGKPKGEWFVYNPAWVTNKNMTGNSLGLLHIAPKEEDDNKWISITYQAYSIDDEDIIYVTEKIKPWENVERSNIFEIELYCQGEKLIYDDKTTLETTWSLFDQEGGNYKGEIISPISVSTISGTDMINYNGFGMVSILEEPEIGGNWNDVWTYQNDDIFQQSYSSRTVMSILQVKARAKQQSGSLQDIEQDPTNSPFFVYAYYPIETTYISKSSIIHDYIPTLVGGFDNIIYNTGGLLPEFDSSHPFKIYGIDGLKKIEEEAISILEEYDPEIKHICEYHWMHSPNIFTSLPSQETKFTDSLYFQPASKIKNEWSKNYVKVQIDFNDSLREAIEQNITDLMFQIIYDFTTFSTYKIIKENAVIFDKFNDGTDNCIYAQIKKMLYDNAIHLIVTEQYEIILNEIKEKLDILLEYFNKYEEEARDKEYYNDYQTIENYIQNYINDINQEINYIDEIHHVSDLNAIRELLSSIENIFPDRAAEERYVFTDGEETLIKSVFEYKDENDNKFLSKLEQNYNSYQNFIKYSKYAYYYNELIFDPFPAAEMSEIYENIKILLKSFLSEGPDPDNYPQDPGELDINKEQWRKLLLLNTTLYKEDLAIRKTDFRKLNQLLWSYYYNIRLSNGINSISTIDNDIELCNETLNKYKHYNIDEMYNNYQNKINQELEKLNKLVQVFSLIGGYNNTYKIIHTKPILMLMNRYELGFLNGWDGNKLKIDENGGYIMAPTMGAGRKDKDNSFTGMVMGIYKYPNQSSERIGLFGRCQGKETLFLDSQTGAAIFGTAGDGQIYIDPTPNEGGKIFSGNYYPEYDLITGKPNYNSHNENSQDDNKKQGMLIDLKDGLIHFGGKSKAKLYSGLHDEHESKEEGFCLDPKGLTIGTGVNIDKKGKIILGIESDTVGERKYIRFDPDTREFKIGEDVEVFANKVTAEMLYGMNFVIKDGGSIHDPLNNFIIKESGIIINNGNINITSGSITLGNDFSVDSTGKLTASNAVITGKLTAGKGSKIGDGSWVGNWKVKENGKLIGFNVQVDNPLNSTLRLDPAARRIGFWTGLQRQADPSQNDFAYIGAGVEMRNTMAVYSGNLLSDGYANFYCNELHAKEVYSSNCALKKNYIYIGCTGEDEGIRAHKGARISSSGNIEVVSKVNNIWRWVPKT